MTVRIVTTPLAAPTNPPPLREGRVAPDLLPAFSAGPGAEALLARLTQPEALIVSTGQQPGLLTGPLYAVHKALSAACLARHMEARFGRPVVPVFWVAGDDHDFAEANHATWFGQDGQPATGVLRQRDAEAPLLPLYREPVGPEIASLLEQFGQALPPSPSRERTLDWLARHYRPDASLAGAYRDAMAELLAPFGVLMFDPTHPAARRAARTPLAAALRQAAPLHDALLELDKVWRRAGREPPVTLDDRATLVMLEAGQGRDRLMLDGSGFLTRRSGERFSLNQLEEVAERTPERLSANVLLRPVLESALLPTVAYVAGPGELGYLELCGPIYQALEIPRQQPFPRWSGMLVEPRVDRVLEKFSVTLEQLLEPGGRLEAQIARAQLPEGAVAALERLRREIATGFAVLSETAAAVDPTIQKTILNLSHQAESATQDAERKLVSHLKKRQATELAQIGRARAALQPDGKQQERVITVGAFIGRYGWEVLDQLAQAIDAWITPALEGAPEPS